MGLVASLTALFVVNSAHASGVDSLRESAKHAMEAGNPAQAVADLRRARVSILAEGRDETLRAELTRAETRWIEGLLRVEMQRGATERAPHLLALRAEAVRIENAEATAAAEEAIEQTALRVWSTNRGADDAQELSLLDTWASFQKERPAIARLFEGPRATVLGKIARFSAPGMDGDFARARLRAFYLLDDPAPPDPHPTRIRLDDGSSWPTGSCGGALAEVRKRLSAGPGEPLQIAVSSAECAVTQHESASKHPVTWTEMVDVPRMERIVTTKKVRRSMAVQTESCTPVSSCEVHTGVGLEVCRTTQVCKPAFSEREVEEEVETVRFEKHVDKVSRTFQENVPSLVRESTLRVRVRAVFTSGSESAETTFEDVVSTKQEQFDHPKGGKASFVADIRPVLDATASDRIHAAFEAFGKHTLKVRRVRELRGQLASTADANVRFPLLCELLTLEDGPDPELVRGVVATTALPEAAVTSALVGGRRSRGEALVASEPFWTLPKANPEAERDAFEEEDRSVVAQRGLQTSGGIGLGAGVAAFPSGPAFPHALLRVDLSYVPAFLLYRVYTAALFGEVAGGLGKALPLRAAGGLSAGFHVGSVTFLGIGALGMDVISFNRDDDQALGPNEPEVDIAPLAGYGGKVIVRAGDVFASVSARRNHRRSDALPISNALDTALGYGAFRLGARYETYRDVFGSAPNNVLWSLGITLGVAFEIQAAEAGEMTGRSGDR